ncbi:hypothetical protein [Aestuariivirga sp.]|uniref:hypothetical protein n=1 Tax=Aestuariivirga sp. TaxID=2650926 RepID=UPI0039E2A7E3
MLRKAISAAIVLAALTGPALSKTYVHTPPMGSAERKAIMDAMRAKGDLPNRIFIVKFLKVSQGWAWLEADPRSKDGKQSYEPESALLQQTGKAWKVVDQPCAEESCDADEELSRIKTGHPEAPAVIFPK